MLRKLLALTLVFTTIPSAQAAPTYVFPVVNCEVNYARAHHDYPASDILAKAGCRFVAPTSGVVDEVSRVDTWRSPPNLGITRGGLSVSIIGDDGVRYTVPFAFHSCKYQPGVVVKAGRLLGTIVQQEVRVAQLHIFTLESLGQHHQIHGGFAAALSCRGSI